MSKQRYGQKQSHPALRWVYLVVFSLSTLWLLSSIITQKSPTDVLSSIFSKLPNPTVENSKTIIASQDSIINQLTEELENCKGTGNFKRGMVIIESETLNMRDEASLTSNIVIRIPANAEVDIVYYDTQSYILQGKMGKWCKIRYAGTEGWVWGNFIQEF